MKKALFIAATLIFANFASNAKAELACKTKLQSYYGLKVYNITLCKNSDVNYDNLFNTSFSVNLHYLISSSSKWIGNKSLSEIKKLYKLNKEEQIAYKTQFDGFFPSVKNGDEIKMDFDPKSGVKFYFNGKFFGQITELTLAIRTANIWLHPNSSFKDTRDFLFANE
jgi:Chalcone isomerase-like